MKLDELEVIVPRLKAVQDALGVLPDLGDEAQAELLRALAKDLRGATDLMEAVK